MAKKWLNPRDFADLIERFNPFGFKESDGTVRVFENYGKLYYYVMEQLITMFPRGYIDIPLFLEQQMHIPMAECQQLVKEYKHTGITQEEYLINLSIDNAERTAFLRNLLTSMHVISGTNFSEDYFRHALELFNARNEKLNVEERTETGEIVGLDEIEDIHVY